MHKHPVWKFAVEVNDRCPTYFTGATALWFLEWKTSDRKPDWTPNVFQLGVFGSTAQEMAAFAFVTALSRRMDESKSTAYARVFQLDEFPIWFAMEADPMDVMHKFTISWAQLVMYVDDESILESQVREASVESGVGSWFPPVHWSWTKREEERKKWDSRPYLMSWEPNKPLKSRVSVPSTRKIWAEWISPSPKKQRNDTS